MNTLTITKQTMFRQFEFIAALVEQGDVTFSYESAGANGVASTGWYEKKPFGAKRFEGQRKTYSSERQKTYGDKPSFGDKAPRSERKSFGDKPAYSSERPAYSSDKPAYTKKSFGSKPWYDKVPSGDKPSFRDKKPYWAKKVYSK